MSTDNKDWYAWIDLMPPAPHHFHVVGEILVANPGVEALLLPKQPQGINPSVLLLDLHLVQKPGIWPQIETWVQARYDKTIVPGASAYKEVQVFNAKGLLATMAVHEVQ